MERVPIAEVRPELPSLDEKEFRAVVTIFWPYSSLKGYTALLLAEPDFRLRHKKGQVRVRFQGPSANALGQSGIAIGDEVLLSLRGARFVQQETGINTPGKSIDWELSFREKLALRIFREGEEIANIDIEEPSPPEPSAPQKILETPSKTVSVGPISSVEWASPAFMKRTRLSDGPILPIGYDTLASDLMDGEGHRDKRRRRSYKDWTVWRYASRTPSPEKDEEHLAQDSGSEMQFTPVPKPTASLGEPVSPPPALVSSHTETEKPKSSIGNQVEAIKVSAQILDEPHVPQGDEAEVQVVRDQEYYDLYAGPDEFPHPEPVEEDGVDRERESERGPPLMGINESSDVSEAGLEVEPVETEASETIASAAVQLDIAEPEVQGQDTHDEPQGLDAVILSSTEEDTSEDEVQSDTEDGPVTGVEEHSSEVVMPPPALSLLNTDLPPFKSPGSLTPIGKQPLSPVIRPLESSTLPLPSPFPGERDQNLTSYLDSSGMAPSGPSDEPEYILGSNFYAPIGGFKSPSRLRPTHDSAFTDLRFTFGFDGAAVSRLSHQVFRTKSPDHEDKTAESRHSSPDVTDEGNHEQVPTEYMEVDVAVEEIQPQPTASIKDDSSADLPVGLPEEVEAEISDEGERDRLEGDIESIPSEDDAQNTEEETGDDSSDGSVDESEDESDQSSIEDTFNDDDSVEDEDMGEATEQESDYASPQPRDEGVGLTTTTPKMEAFTEIIDLGSGSSDDESDDDDGQDAQLHSSTKKSISPPEAGSVFFSKQDADSPYFGRFQNENRSPMQNMSHSPVPSASRNTAVSDAESDDDVVMLHGSVSQEPSEAANLPTIAPSQELGATRSRFADTSVVRDSEEETLHSENSISTVQNSDDQFYPEFLVSSPRLHESGQIVSTKQASYASITEQPGHGSSPGEIRTVVHVISSDSEDEIASVDTITNQEYVYYPDLPLNDKTQEMSVYEEQISLSTHKQSLYPDLPLNGKTGDLAVYEHVSEQISVSTHQQSFGHSHLPNTPEQSQVENAEERIHFTAELAGQSLPLSPQLTQKTSGGVMESFIEASPEMVPPGHAVKVQNIQSPSKIESMVSEHAAAADVGTTPDSDSPKEQIEEPSNGFMSSVGCYDPIRDLTCYLGRGSNLDSFPASMWPDVFALVVEATTEPKRAEKYPYHYATTLRITDVSSFPQSTVVQIFRPHADALPVAEKGDVILLRTFIVKTANHKVMLVSGEESGWVVWRWNKVIPGVEKLDKTKAVRARMEIRGPWVETQDAELEESRKVRGWWDRYVMGRLEEMVNANGKGGGSEKVASVGRKITNGASG